MTDLERDDMRRYAREEAEAAGLTQTLVDYVVDMAVGNAMSVEGAIDRDYFEQLVDGIIQGVATEFSVDPEACPGCGCKPGDGITFGCDHPEGCGYWRSFNEKEKR